MDESALRGSERALWYALREDPNNAEAFSRLSEIVRRRAASGVSGDDPARAAADAGWALAEEVGQIPGAWYPLLELGRLSVAGDREAAMRRFVTASGRDPSGRALATGLRILLDAGHPDLAFALGVASWRPADHGVGPGEQLLEAALAAGRAGEARRHLEALAARIDRETDADLRRRVERLAADAERARHRPREIDLREPERATAGLARIFRRR